MHVECALTQDRGFEAWFPPSEQQAEFFLELLVGEGTECHRDPGKAGGAPTERLLGKVYSASC